MNCLAGEKGLLLVERAEHGLGPLVHCRDGRLDRVRRNVAQPPRVADPCRQNLGHALEYLPVSEHLRGSQSAMNSSTTTGLQRSGRPST